MNTKTIIILCSVFLAMLGTKWGYDAKFNYDKLNQEARIAQNIVDRFTFEKYTAGNTAYLFLLDKTDGRIWSLSFDKENRKYLTEIEYYSDTHFSSTCLYSVLSKDEINFYFKTNAKDKLYAPPPKNKIEDLVECKKKEDEAFDRWLNDRSKIDGKQSRENNNVIEKDQLKKR